MRRHQPGKELKCDNNQNDVEASSGELVLFGRNDAKLGHNKQQKVPMTLCQVAAKWILDIVLFIICFDLTMHLIALVVGPVFVFPSAGWKKAEASQATTNLAKAQQPTLAREKWVEALAQKCAHPRQRAFSTVNGDFKAGNCTLRWDLDRTPGSLSTSQNMEDAVIFERFFTGASPLAHLGIGNGNGASTGGTFLEIGAADGLTYSRTIAFEYCAGWDGILIEPNPKASKVLQENRPCTVVIPEAVCRKERGGTIRMSDQGGTSFDLSLKEEFPNRKVDAEVEVPCRPLGRMLNEYGVKRINFFSLHVEGSELNVLEAFDFRKVQIDVLLVDVDIESPENVKRVETLRELMMKSGLKRVPSRLDPGNRSAEDNRLCARNGRPGNGVYDCILLSIAKSDVYVSPELYEYDTKPWEFKK
jgi:FkbM family methyltransferase